MADRGSIGGLGQVDGTGGAATHGTGFAPSPGAVTNGSGSFAAPPGVGGIILSAAGGSGVVTVTGTANSVVVVDG